MSSVLWGEKYVKMCDLLINNFLLAYKFGAVKNSKNGFRNTHVHANKYTHKYIYLYVLVYMEI